MAILFLDHLINDVNLRFSKHSKEVATLQGIFPINITSSTTFSDIESAICLYSDDLPNAAILDEELHHWKTRWLQTAEQEKPKSLSEALKNCSPDNLPNVHVLLKIFATFPFAPVPVKDQNLHFVDLTIIFDPHRLLRD